MSLRFLLTCASLILRYKIFFLSFNRLYDDLLHSADIWIKSLISLPVLHLYGWKILVVTHVCLSSVKIVSVFSTCHALGYVIINVWSSFSTLNPSYFGGCSNGSINSRMMSPDSWSKSIKLIVLSLTIDRVTGVARNMWLHIIYVVIINSLDITFHCILFCYKCANNFKMTKIL